MVLKDFWEGFPDRADTSAFYVVLYYADAAAEPGQRLQEVLNNDLPQIQVELFTGFEELVTGLQRPEAEPLVVVLVIGDRVELDEFLSLRSVLEETRVILVLPDDSEEIRSLAQRLDPHYVCTVEDDFVEVATVIDEILQERRVATPEGEPLPPDHNL